MRTFNLDEHKVIINVYRANFEISIDGECHLEFFEGCIDCSVLENVEDAMESIIHFYNLDLSSDAKQKLSDELKDIYYPHSIEILGEEPNE